MTSKAIARIVPIGTSDNRQPFYAASVQQVNKCIRGNTVKGSLFNMRADLWKVEMLWNGEGLPPVGTECEVRESDSNSPFFKWQSCTISAINIKPCGENQICVIDGNGDFAIVYSINNFAKFRPIRSARDKAVDKIKELLMYDYGDDPRVNDAIFIYDAIAAGKIPGVKLEND